jgi:hypothetical protein
MGECVFPSLFSEFWARYSILKQSVQHKKANSVVHRGIGQIVATVIVLDPSDVRADLACHLTIVLVL